MENGKRTNNVIALFYNWCFIIPFIVFILGKKQAVAEN